MLMKNLYTIKNCLNENLILLMYLKSYNYDNDKAFSYLKIVLGQGRLKNAAFY